MPPFNCLAKCRPLVVMKKVLRNACALRFPVAPDSHGAVMDVVAAQNHVDGRMHLDACDLRTAQFHHVVDVMDVVVLNDG